MTDPNFHQRMVNIPVDEASAAFPEPPHLQLVYRYGHRDARRAAAEIANEADEAICELQRHIDDLMSGEALKAAKDLDDAHRALIARLRSDLRRQELCAEEVIRRLQSERRAALEEVDRLTKSRDYVTSELRSAVDRLGLRPALADALRGADPDKATAEQLARFIWIWSHDASSSSASDAAMRFVGDEGERFAAAINEARAWMQAHRGGEWVGWSAAILTGTQEVTSPGWYALPPGQWVSEPAILIEHVARDGMELPTVEQAVERWGVPAKGDE